MIVHNIHSPPHNGERSVARGRVLERSLSKSDKLNALYTREYGELAIAIYCLSYPYADDWGHLPFEATFIKRECLCDCARSLAEIREAMLALVAVGLWEYVYRHGDKHYVYIHQFASRNREAIRHRRVGQYPDESGRIPQRLRDQPIEDSLAAASATRRTVQTVTFSRSNYD